MNGSCVSPFYRESANLVGYLIKICIEVVLVCFDCELTELGSARETSNTVAEHNFKGGGHR